MGWDGEARFAAYDSPHASTPRRLGDKPWPLELAAVRYNSVRSLRPVGIRGVTAELFAPRFRAVQVCSSGHCDALPQHPKSNGRRVDDVQTSAAITTRKGAQWTGQRR